MAEMITVKTYTAYFTVGDKIYHCMAWVKSLEELNSLLDQKFSGLKRRDFAYCETNLIKGKIPNQRSFVSIGEYAMNGKTV